MTNRYTLEQHQAHVEAEEKRKATEEQFERAWPELRDQDRPQRTLDRDRAAREAQRANSGSRI